MRKLSIVAFTFLLCGGLAVWDAVAASDYVIVGVNTVGAERMNEQQQDAFVEQLGENGVKVVRLGMDEKYTHFITRAYEPGIGTVAVVFPWFGSEKNSAHSPWAALPNPAGLNAP